MNWYDFLKYNGEPERHGDDGPVAVVIIALMLSSKTMSP